VRFGGSFLNHQWLIAAAAPVFANADQSGTTTDLHSIVDSAGFPNNTYPLDHPSVTAPLGSRDAGVADLSAVFEAHSNDNNND